MKKEITDLINNLPDKYKFTLYYVMNYAHSCFGDNLCNLTIGGSGGKNNIIEGWSDIDLYIILHEYKIDEIVNFMKYIQDLEIHIGTTYYTLDELEKGLIDSKTKVMCYEKQNYEVNPTLYGENVFKDIPYNVIVENDLKNLPNILHDFRRRYIELISSDDNKVTKTYIKKLLVLIKCLLNCYGIFSYGYEASVDNFKLLAKNMGYDLTAIDDFDIISAIHNIDNERENIINFSTFLLKFIEFNCKKRGDNKKWKKELVLGQ